MKRAVLFLLLASMTLLGIGCGDSAENTTTNTPAIEGPAFVLFFTDP